MVPRSGNSLVPTASSLAATETSLTPGANSRPTHHAGTQLLHSHRSLALEDPAGGARRGPRRALRANWSRRWSVA